MKKTRIVWDRVAKLIIFLVSTVILMYMTFKITFTTIGLSWAGVVYYMICLITSISLLTDSYCGYCERKANRK